MVSGNDYIGKQIGNYLIMKEIARGSFGRVYLARHKHLKNRIVAIKLLLDMRIGSEQERENFLKEAQFLDDLKHPHILPIVDVDIDNELAYLVAEYATNGSLRDRVKRQSGNPLPLEEALSILSQVGQALQYAHQQNIVHRDLKPENILYNAKGEVLLADFGIATILDTAGSKQLDTSGTPSYMAPEQFKGMISKKIDQYALGCIAYELFTGRKPFTSPDIYALMYKHMNEDPVPPRKLNPQLPVYIEQAILKAMAKQRTERFEDVSTFIAALQKSAEQWLEEGNNYYKANRTEEALIAYEQATQLAPGYAPAYYNQASVLCELRRYEEALVAYERVIQLDPNFVGAQIGKEKALSGLMHSNEALASSAKKIAKSASRKSSSRNAAVPSPFLGQRPQYSRGSQSAISPDTPNRQQADENGNDPLNVINIHKQQAVVKSPWKLPVHPA